MIIKPLFDRVLLKKEDKPQMHGAIYIPKSEADKCNIMTVIATGDNSKDIVKKGERIILHKFAGVEIETSEGKFTIAKITDILAKEEQ